MATIFSDAFTTSNGALAGYNGWSTHATSAGSHTVASNAVVETSQTNTALSINSASIGSADYQVSVDLIGPASSTGQGGVVARCNASAATFYNARFNGGLVQLYKFITGTATKLGADVSRTITTSNKITLKCVGTTISVLWDDGEIISVTDSSITAEGKAGIRSLAEVVKLDNLLVEDFSAGAQVPIKSVSQSLGVQSATASAVAHHSRRFG